MALFKIFNNFDNPNHTLPTSTHKGYCYFDVKTKLFWIDIADSNGVTLTSENISNYRVPLNANLAAAAGLLVNENGEWSSVPEKTSDLVNDSGFLTSFTETDPTVPSWAKASSKPSYTASEVGAAASSHTHGNITNSGDITANATIANGDRLVINDESASKITNSSITFGTNASQYLSNKGTWQNVPTVPTNISAFTNDSGYTTNTGTITGVSVNGTSVATSGVANITSIPASILSGTIPSGVTATTQDSSDNSTEIATTAFVKNNLGGLSGAMHFKGTTTTALTDGATTAAVTINSSSYTPSAGDVVLYSDSEFVWTGTAWERLGRDSSFKVTQSTVSDPTASGTSTSFIKTISQDANGVITATKANLPTATTSVAGIMAMSQANLNTMINQLGTGSSTPVDADYYISQYVGGGSNTVTYHRRPMSALYDYVKGKLNVTNNNINLSRNTETTIATIGGTAIKIKLPASDNTWRGIQDNLTSDSATDSLSAKQGKALANGSARDSTKLPLTGGTLTGGLEIKGHIAGDSNTTGHGLYSGGGYHNAYNNIILHGDATTGTSGIAFISDKGDTAINQPSDRAFIQWHAMGVTTYTAEGTAPTLATTGEANVLMIGVGNDATDQVRIQTPGRTGLLHQVASAGYVIPDTNNTTGTVGSGTQPVWVDGGVIKNTTYTLGKSVPSNAVFTDTDTKQNITLATTSKAFLTGVTTTPTSTAQALTGIADTGVYLTTTAGELSSVRHSFNVGGTEKAYMAFNNTTNAIDFVFV